MLEITRLVFLESGNQVIKQKTIYNQTAETTPLQTKSNDSFSVENLLKDVKALHSDDRH